MTSVLGPIILQDRNIGSERTAPQVLSSPIFDSRLARRNVLTYRCIRELRKDPTIQLARWAVLAPMVHTPWMYLNNKSKASKEMLDFVEEVFTPLRDSFLLQAVFGTLDFGWKPFEIVYKPEDGYVHIDNFKSLLHEYTDILVYVNTGRFAGFANETFGYDANHIIPEKYALNINFDSEGTDWYGFSVFESLQKVDRAWNDVEGAANRFDKKVAGATWIVYFPVGKTLWNGIQTENSTIAKGILDSLEASGGAIIPDEIQEWIDDTIDREAKGKWRLELISATTSNSTQFIDRQKYLDALKMRAFALPERAILEGSHGTKAEADVHSDIALATVDTRHRLICDQLNCHVLPKLMDINFGKKYQYAVKIRPAPLVDTQFSMIKEFYRLILQTPETLIKEINNIDMKGLRDELGLPSSIVGDQQNG